MQKIACAGQYRLIDRDRAYFLDATTTSSHSPKFISSIIPSPAKAFGRFEMDGPSRINVARTSHFEHHVRS